MKIDNRRWSESSVFITGACGSVGREIVAMLCEADVANIVGVDNNESEIFNISNEYEGRENIQFYVADVRDRARMEEAMRGCDIVIHTAALKHVYICERSPRDAVQTNISGTLNVIEAAITTGAKRVMFTSSDKAVSPTGVLGTSKLMGERLVTAAAASNGTGPIFASTRFGNVIGSRGSVVPLFCRQILAGGPVTITDPRMTRFMITISEAASLVLNTAFLATGGEVFVPKMPVIRIPDLAEAAIAEAQTISSRVSDRIPIETVGARAGEKLYEELLNDEDIRRAVETDDYFVIVPSLSRSVGRETANRWNDKGVPVRRAYNSSQEEAMTLSQLRNYLRDHNVLDEFVN